MLSVDFESAGEGGGGVVIIGADEIRGEASVIVDVGFVVRHPDGVPEFGEGRGLAGSDESFEVAGQQFVLGGVVIGGGGKGEAVSRVGGEAESVVVGLEPVVALARGAAVAFLDEWEQAAGGVSWGVVGIYGYVELMVFGLGADTVQRFVMEAIGFTADDEADPGCCEEVAFVGGIDEHAGEDIER
ncbi:MAG: hypothetical protein RI897_3416 [Verrucomicrobiota bacterium]